MKTLNYAGETSIIHEGTGVLLQPGQNKIQKDADADAIVADGLATLATGSAPAAPKPPRARKKKTPPAS
jgi:hypothetical protein